MGGINGARGEVALEIGGRRCRLCLTLGALAEIETGLSCCNLASLHERLSCMSASDLLVVLAALLRGGGEDAVASGLASERMDIGDAVRAVSACFSDGSI